MIKADLHMHTQVSDGIYTAAEMIERSIAAGLDIIAITDHDTKPDENLFAQYQAQYPIRIIPGIECGTKDSKTGIRAHILGYGVNDYTEIVTLTAPVLRQRQANSRELIDRVNELGYPLTEAEVRSHTAAEVLYRQHIIYALWRKELIPEMWGSWYREMFGRGGALCIANQYPEPAQMVEAIVNGGGTAVLAHPGQQQNFYLVPELAECGMTGIEWIHPSNSEQDRGQIRSLSRQYGLFLTGGSDCHGILSPSGAAIGSSYITYEELPGPLVL